MTRHLRPGSWLDGAELHGSAEITDPRHGCGCRVPLVWDGNRGAWRHVDDGSDCVKNDPAHRGKGVATRQAAARASIAAAIIVDGGRVLMVRRRVAEGDLSWQFPAGEIEHGESAEEAAVREVKEETGLTVRAAERLGERAHPTTGRTMVYVACSVVGGEPRIGDEEELVEVAWCDRATLIGYVPYPFFAPVQRHLNAALR